ncbi:MAG: ABC transporter permease [Ahniella sp.]|nr:ABC transporter permease [Ahniella sp.]
MKRLKEFLFQLLILILLALLLAGWVKLSAWGAGIVVILLALWLALTRTGRQTVAITHIGLSTLPQRLGISSVIVIGIAGVVGVLVAMLAMSEGFKRTLEPSGSEEAGIILRGGSRVEVNSVITRDQAALISALPGIARDAENRGQVSAEMSQIVTLLNQSDGLESNAQIRGVGEQGWTIRPNIQLTAGRKFEPGKRELVVGEAAQGQFQGLALGSVLELSNQDWTIVGSFKAGNAHDSELWADATTLAAAYNRQSFQSVTVRLAGAEGLAQLKVALDDDPRLKLDVETTRNYYVKQSEGLSNLISVLGTVIGGIMAIGAVFGALNTMYAAVAGRAREIGTMRALGFKGLPVVVAVMLETMLLAAIGGLLGAFLAWLIFNGYSVSTLSENFSQVVFQFHVSPGLLWPGMKWALAIGLIGGSFPAIRAARMQITEALRSV